MDFYVAMTEILQTEVHGNSRKSTSVPWCHHLKTGSSLKMNEVPHDEGQRKRHQRKRLSQKELENQATKHH
jgi:hypothetical protein